MNCGNSGFLSANTRTPPTRILFPNFGYFFNYTKPTKIITTIQSLSHTLNIAHCIYESNTIGGWHAFKGDRT
jgi:hypothetical protein